MNRLTKFRQCLLFYIFLTGLACFVGVLPANILGQQKHLKKILAKAFKRSVNKERFDKIKFGIETKGVRTVTNLIVTTDEEILFYGENGNIISRRSHKVPFSVVYSKQGKYLVLEETLREAEKGVKNGIHALRLINNQNRIVWEKTEEFGYEDETGSGMPLVSDKDGTSIRFRTPWIFEMYNSTGQLFKTVKLMEGKSSQINAFGYYCDWSEDGNYFAVLTQEKGASHGAKKQFRIPLRGPRKGERIEIPAYPPSSGNPWVFLFDRFGNEIWHRRIPEYSANGIVVSPDGKYVIANGMTNTLTEYKFGLHIFDREGNEINSFQEGHKCAFSKDGNFVVLSDRSNVLFVELKQGNILWKKKFDKYPFSCSVSANGNRIAVLKANLKRYDCLDPELSVYNHNGEKILEHVFTDNTCRIVAGDTDRLKISDDGNVVVILFKDKMASFRISD